MFEGIIGKCVDRGLVHRSEVMLLNGLKTSLKDISGHKYDTIKDFDGLRVALRQIENYHIPQKSTSTSKPHINKTVRGQSDSTIGYQNGFL